jgi:DNA-directed RNA polymerase subunit beta'
MQDKLLKHTESHPGTMTPMAKSKARGNMAQLMKTVSSPVAAVDTSGKIVPWLIGKSYSEGLSSADYWVTGNEARINTVKSATSVSEPGDVSKMFVNTMYPLIISRDDCGTRNGIVLSSQDHHILGRYLSKDQAGHKYNELVTPAVAAALRKNGDHAYVRSPMTCDAHEGICKKCQGLDERGQPHAVGVNVGIRAAQALSEPLTQIALDAKHAKRVLKGASKTLGGMAGIRQLVEVPQSFFAKATLAEKAGKVTEIKAAPHGGFYVYVDGVEHYSAPTLDVTVHVGQHVEAGDCLNNGVPKPDELVQHKGLGAGREYLVKALHGLFRDAGPDLDKRHLELLARADINYVRVAEHSDHHPNLLKGDVVSYQHFKEIAEQNTHDVPVDKAVGHVLGKEILHFTVGTPITESIVASLKAHNVKQVWVSKTAPRVEFLMKPLTRTPLLNPDWMARLSHRYLKESLMKGAHNSDVTNLHGPHPIPAYAFGAEFGTGPEGRY